jgi:monoamine oxidase
VANATSGGNEVTPSSVDVAVIGAGLAGLSAARTIANAGHSVAVLEARDRVGGRTLNVSIAAGKSVEIGGQWVGPTQKRVLALMAASWHRAPGAQMVRRCALQSGQSIGRVPRLQRFGMAIWMVQSAPEKRRRGR